MAHGDKRSIWQRLLMRQPPPRYPEIVAARQGLFARIAL